MIIYAQRGNRVKRIAESDIAKYAEQGYTVKDDKGNVLKETIPTDLATLRTEYAKHIETIKKLTAQVAELEAKVNALTDNKVQSSEPVTESDTPTRKRRTAKTEE